MSTHRRTCRDLLDRAGELLRALAAPVRIAIVMQLRESQRCVHELVDALDVPQPLVTSTCASSRPPVSSPASVPGAK